MIAALAALSEVLGERCPPVSVFLGGDEEVGSSSSRQHIRRIAGQCSATLVLEAAMPDGSLVHERKGSGLHHVKVQGRSAHAGLAPEKGANAIMALARALLAVEELGRPESGTTVNIARIEGGGNPGVVPDFAKALVNFRVRTKEEQSRVEQGLSSIASRCFVAGTTVTAEGEFHRPPMVPGPGFDDLLLMVREESAALGLSVSLASIGATNDANLAAEVCPAVLDGFGPVGGGLHSDEEYIEVDSLATKACLLAFVLARFAE
jgi:glutamate carboxypeptidase